MNPKAADDNYIFCYTVPGKTTLSGLGRTGTSFSIISAVIVTVLLIVFTVQGIYADTDFFILAAFMAVLFILFVPYQFWIKKYYFIGLRKDSILEMRSVINFIPKSYTINIQSISLIRQQDIRISPALLFYDRSSKLISKFNPMMIPQKTFLNYLREIKSLNTEIQFGFKV